MDQPCSCPVDHDQTALVSHAGAGITAEVAGANQPPITDRVHGERVPRTDRNLSHFVRSRNFSFVVSLAGWLKWLREFPSCVREVND